MKRARREAGVEGDRVARERVSGGGCQFGSAGLREGEILMPL